MVATKSPSSARYLAFSFAALLADPVVSGNRPTLFLCGRIARDSGLTSVCFPPL
jgi:hypothetical protein